MVSRKELERVVIGEYLLTPEEVVEITSQFYESYQRKENVVPIPEKDLIFVGDLHGELEPLKAVVNKFVKQDKTHIVFLGDYADRGPHQVETFNAVMALALLYPNRITLLRGNHESTEVARHYGFSYAIAETYSKELERTYFRVFEVFPIAALSKSGLFCCHGGVPEGLSSLSQLNTLNRFVSNPVDRVLFQLLWNDPREGPFRFSPNMRGGGSRYFGRKAFEEFRSHFGITQMIRGHEVFPDGFKYFFDENLVSVFSATYQGMVNPKVIVCSESNNLRPFPLVSFR